MATIPSALVAGVLEEYALPGHCGGDPKRSLFLASELFDRLDSDDDLHIEKWSKHWGGRTRFEHVEQMFCEFRTAKHALVGDLHRLIPNPKGVWKMQPRGTRIYGWVPYPSAFVAVTYALEEDAHGGGSRTAALVAEVLSFATKHNLKNTINLGDRRALFPPQA